MGLILGCAVVIITLFACFAMIFAAGMSDAPSMDNPLPLKSTFFIGMFIGVVLIFTHFYPIHLGW